MSPLIMNHGVLQIISLLHFLLLIFPISLSLSSPPQVTMREEKFRLGSMPPSCHNRCNNCNPCTAVQVPTLPGPTGQLSLPADQPAYNQFNSNYKPLGWKCFCEGRVYNP